MRLELGEQQLCMGQGIAGVLDPDLVAGGQQHADGDVDRLLGPGGNDDLIHLAAHRARRSQVVADVGTQLGKPGGIRIAKLIWPEPAHRPMGQAAPCLRRSRVDQGAAGVERSRIALHGRPFEIGKGPRRFRHRAQARTRRHAPPHRQAGDIVGDEGARAMAAFDIAFGQQLLIGRDHGGPRHTEPQRHRARGGHARTRAKRTRQHGRAHLRIELTRQRRSARPIELPGIEVGESARRRPRSGPGSGLLHLAKLDHPDGPVKG